MGMTLKVYVSVYLAKAPRGELPRVRAPCRSDIRSINSELGMGKTHEEMEMVKATHEICKLEFFQKDLLTSARRNPFRNSRVIHVIGILPPVGKVAKEAAIISMIRLALLILRRRTGAHLLISFSIVLVTMFNMNPRPWTLLSQFHSISFQNKWDGNHEYRQPG